MTILITFTYDNGCIIERKRAICLAENIPNAIKLLKERVEKTSEDYVTDINVTILDDEKDLVYVMPL